MLFVGAGMLSAERERIHGDAAFPRRAVPGGDRLIVLYVSECEHRCGQPTPFESDRH